MLGTYIFGIVLDIVLRCSTLQVKVNMYSTNREVNKLKVGDAVTSDYRQKGSKEVFYITELVDNTKPLTAKQLNKMFPFERDYRPQYHFGSGRGVKAESLACDCCHRGGRLLEGDDNFIDAAWVFPVVESKTK